MYAQVTAQKNLNLKPECCSAYNGKNFQLKLKKNLYRSRKSRRQTQSPLHPHVALNVYANSGDLLSNHL